MWSYNYTVSNDCLCHYGIKGMKWGVRRFQNEDGSLTAQGKKRYDNPSSKNKGYQFSDKKFHKGKILVTTKNGDTLSIGEEKPKAFTRFIAKHSKKVRQELENNKMCTIRDKNGKRVGDLEVYKESEDSLNVVWLGIDDSQRGKGYATAVMNGVTKFAQENNLKQITLEVPGISPDARHIYEKQGFVAGEQISDDDDVWGGLTKMVKKIRR